ncbi:MAG: hypothetical protein J0H85_16635 [Sediminibacterium magnilacihabitans]|jgi:hypothetical protein|nr:hypothetical protein [Sediminibacterium magnilacihabitans]
MGGRKVTVKQSAAESIASIAWYIESKGLVAIAEKFTDDVYDYFLKLANPLKSYAVCKDPIRSSLGYKCPGKLIKKYHSSLPFYDRR